MYGSKHRTTDGLYESRKDGSGYSSTKREWNLPTHGTNDDASNHRKYIRTQSSSNNRAVPISSSQQQRQNGDKEKKTVKDAKKPLRTSGDWSEFRSSTGKTYFYNSKTEISQWEKPKGWLSDVTGSSSTRTSTTSTSSDRSKKESTTTNASSSSTVRPRYKMDDASLNPRSQPKDHSSSTSLPKSNTSSALQQHNGHFHSGTSNHTQNESFQSTEPTLTTSSNRLPSPGDDSSRMSFSSTSSKESVAGGTGSSRTTSNHTGRESNGAVLQSSLSEPAIPVSTPTPDIPIRSLDKHFTPLNGSTTKNSTGRFIMPTESGLATMETEPSTPTISKAERDQEIQRYYRADLIQHLTDWSSTQLEKQCLKLFDEYYGYSAKMSTPFTELKALKSSFRVLEIKRSIITQRLLRCQQHMKEREDDQFS